jgi:hypothetical protein
VPYLAFQHTWMGAAAPPYRTRALSSLSGGLRMETRGRRSLSLSLNIIIYIELNLSWSRPLLLAPRSHHARKHAICQSAISFIAAWPLNGDFRETLSHLRMGRTPLRFLVESDTQNIPSRVWVVFRRYLCQVSLWWCYLWGKYDNLRFRLWSLLWPTKLLFLQLENIQR